MSFSSADIAEAAARLRPYVRRTPVMPWRGPTIDALFGAEAEIFLKLELFQVTGTFKARGAMVNALALSPDALAAGLTAVSAGNHAVAVAYAAHALGTSAKVVMIETANPFRVSLCKHYGAEVVMAGDGASAFARVEEIKAAEGRAFIHPFEGPLTALGSATLGAELAEQLPGLDAVIVAVGGGGLPGGVSRALKLADPRIEVFGVEPEGADNMRRSLDAGEPVKLPSDRHHRRQPRPALFAALQLRPLPRPSRRSRPGQRRRDPRRDEAAVRRGQAGGGAGRRGGDGGAVRAVAGAAQGKRIGDHRLRREYRSGELREGAEDPEMKRLEYPREKIDCHVFTAIANTGRILSQEIPRSTMVRRPSRGRRRGCRRAFEGFDIRRQCFWSAPFHLLLALLEREKAKCERRRLELWFSALAEFGVWLGLTTGSPAGSDLGLRDSPRAGSRRDCCSLVEKRSPTSRSSSGLRLTAFWSHYSAGPLAGDAVPAAGWPASQAPVSADARLGDLGEGRQAAEGGSGKERRAARPREEYRQLPITGLQCPRSARD